MSGQWVVMAVAWLALALGASAALGSLLGRRLRRNRRRMSGPSARRCGWRTSYGGICTGVLRE